MIPDARRRHAVLRDREDRELFALRNLERQAWAEERRLERRLRELDAQQSAVRNAIDPQRRGH